MAKPTEQSGESFMLKLARFIVDKRNLVFLVVIIGLIFSVFSRSWVQVENDLTAYLPADSETRQALDVMDEQFTTFGTASVMVANLPLADAFDLQEKLEDVEGVQGVAFDETDEHYNNVSALFSVTFDYDEDDERCLDALERVKNSLAGYDLYVSTDLGNTQEETIDHEISVIMVYVAIVIVTVLLFTSETYGEVPVLILTFVVALVLNQGTNFMMGKISFISNSVTSILQLALSIDYAIMEKADNVYVQTVDLGWSDLGTWRSLHEMSPRTREGNVTQNCKVLTQDCANSVFAIAGDKIVVAAGLDGYIVADNGNALLIYPIDQEQKVKQIVNEVGLRFGEKYI